MQRLPAWQHERIFCLACLMVLFVLGAASVQALSTADNSLDIEIGLEARLFAHDGLAKQQTAGTGGSQSGQGNAGQSISLRAEYVVQTGENSRFVMAPFVRLDSEDDKRTHADVRELFWSTLGESWEFSVGAKQVFWGVAEFNHLVDIVNQTDLVENIDGEEKLGQPMAQLSLVRDWGVVDLYAMSGFRERTFPGEDGRLRPPFVIDDEHARYESDDKRSHVEYAVRWSHQIGGLDLGVYHFNGTARAPELVPEARPDGTVELVPEYALIEQTGLDAQYLTGNWACKLEAIHRSGQGESFEAVTAGVEYTFVGVLDSAVDVGVVAEYFHDSRGEEAFDTLLEDDYAVGLRFGFNDADDSRALIGVIRDADSGETAVSIEASRQVGEHVKLSLEGRFFSGAQDLDPDDPASWSGNDRAGFLETEDHVQLELKWFF